MLDLRSPHRRLSSGVLGTICASLLAAPAWAVEFDGVQVTSFDQPRIYAVLKDPNTGAILPQPEGAYIPALLDTGASGVLLSNGYMEALGLIPAQAIDPETGLLVDVTFTDAGVAGAEEFYVSDVLHLMGGQFSDAADPADPAHYTIDAGNVRLMMRQQDPDLGFGPYAVNVFGMPLIKGNVLVYNPRTIEDEVDPTIYTSSFLYAPGTPFNPSDERNNPGIPTTSHHVKLSYSNFDSYTTVHPDTPTTPRPTFYRNPFIGPSPTGEDGPHAEQPEPLVLSHALGGQTRSVTGSWLFDTGASVSFVSEGHAEMLGVYYDYDDETGEPIGLVDAAGNALPNQFSTLIGGVGDGARYVFGIYFDSLTIPTVEGDPITFLNAPLLIGDISIEGPDGQVFTLDGVFGTNFLTASTPLAGSANAFPAPFNWTVFDEPNGILGLDVRYELVPEPSLGLVVVGTGVLLLRRQRRHAA